MIYNGRYYKGKRNNNAMPYVNVKEYVVFYARLINYACFHIKLERVEPE